MSHVLKQTTKEMEIKRSEIRSLKAKIKNIGLSAVHTTEYEYQMQYLNKLKTQLFHEEEILRALEKRYNSLRKLPDDIQE